MVFEIGILLGIASMLSWGISDFLAKKAIDRVGFVTSLVINQAISLVPICVYALLNFRLPPASFEFFLITLSAGVLGVLGYFYLYKGFQKGDLCLVSPISASWSVITVILASLIFKEALSPLQTIGIASVCVGVVLASTKLTELKKSIREGKSNGVLEAVIAMIAWGVTYVLIKPLVLITGPIMSLLFVRLVSVSSVFSWAKITKTKVSSPAKIVLLSLIVAGLLDAAGFASFNLGLTTEFVSIVSPIAATYSAVSVVLAYLFLRERVVSNQKIGVFFILAGIILISLL